MKGGALAHRRLHPDPSAVALHDALDDGKTHAGTFEIRVAMQTLEDAEEPVLSLIHI